MRPETCQNKDCKPVNNACGACINRSAIAKEGYALIQAIEACGASTALTAAVNKAEAFIKLAEEESLKGRE